MLDLGEGRWADCGPRWVICRVLGFEGDKIL